MQGDADHQPVDDGQAGALNIKRLTSAAAFPALPPEGSAPRYGHAKAPISAS